MIIQRESIMPKSEFNKDKDKDKNKDKDKDKNKDNKVVRPNVGKPDIR
jgi:hypothetical protein